MRKSAVQALSLVLLTSLAHAQSALPTSTPAPEPAELPATPPIVNVDTLPTAVAPNVSLPQTGVIETPEPSIQLPQALKEVLAEYDSKVERMDFDLAPRIQDKKLGIRLRGKLFSVTYSQINPLPSHAGWSREHGLRAIVAGEINTFDDHQFNLSLHPFVRWYGTYLAQPDDWAGDIAANYEVAFGPVSAMHDWQTLWVLNTQQEWTGKVDDLTWLPNIARQWSARWTHTGWVVRATQHAKRRMLGQAAHDEDFKTGYGASLLVGLQRDFPWQLFGYDVQVKSSFGPEWRYDRQGGHDIKPRLRVKVVY